MKKILLIISLFTCLSASAQFDDAISRFISDSVFTIHIDSTGNEYVNIQPFKINLKTTYTRIYFQQYNDFSNQPYQILPRRDTVINGDTSILQAIIGVTQSANAHFTMVGNGVSDNESIGITNTNSNAYNGCHAFLSTKFLYWYFCDKFEITISD